MPDRIKPVGGTPEGPQPPRPPAIPAPPAVSPVRPSQAQPAVAPPTPASPAKPAHGSGPAAPAQPARPSAPAISPLATPAMTPAPAAPEPRHAPTHPELREPAHAQESGSAQPAAGAPPPAHPAAPYATHPNFTHLPGTVAPAPRLQLVASLKWAGWLTLGVAVTGVAGYLVAALWLFPAPLLPNERQVPRVGGLVEDDARRALERQGLTMQVAGHEPHPLTAAGAVIWQDPPPGVAVPRGTGVTLILSGGVPRVRVPDVRGYDAEFAQRLLTAAGLRVDGVDTVDVKGIPSGAAGGTNPAAGDSVLLGRSIFLHLAR